LCGYRHLLFPRPDFLPTTAGSLCLKPHLRVFGTFFSLQQLACPASASCKSKCTGIDLFCDPVRQTQQKQKSLRLQEAFYPR
jgi:hypothetical protein